MIYDWFEKSPILRGRASIRRFTKHRRKPDESAWWPGKARRNNSSSSTTGGDHPLQHLPGVPGHARHIGRLRLHAFVRTPFSGGMKDRLRFKPVNYALALPLYNHQVI